MTTNPGRLRFSEPSPYVTHDPAQGKHFKQSWRVIVRSGEARINERHVVDMRGQIRKNLRPPRAALAVLFEGERRLHQRPDAAGKKSGVLVEAVQFLAIALFEFRLVVPRVDLALPAVHKKPDHRLGLGRKMRRPRCHRIAARLCRASRLLAE
jgi:hypothetical protein